MKTSLQHFVAGLKQQIALSRNKWVETVEVETSFGYTIDTEQVDMDKLLQEIDEFTQKFEGS